MESGTLDLEQAGWGLIMGLLLLHLKFQTEPLFSSQVYEEACRIISSTKGSTALGAAFQKLTKELHPTRQRVVNKFFNYLFRLQSSADNDLDSIALATRFGQFLLRPPSGATALTLSRVKLMGALAVLIESFPNNGPQKSSLSPPPKPKSSTSLNSKPASGSVTASAPISTTRSGASPSLAGVQVLDVSQSAVVVIDSSLKALTRLKHEVASCRNEQQLLILLKQLKHLEDSAGRRSNAEYSI